MALAAMVRAGTGAVVSFTLTIFLPRFVGKHRLTLGGIALVSVVVAGFTWTLLDRSALVSLAAAGQVEIPWNRFIRGMDLEYFFVMAAWITGYIALLVASSNRAQRESLLEQQVELQELRLSLLASQLNPHFLFNSLNTIRSLAAEDATRTREVVSRLSSFLRQVVDLKPADLVSVSREMELAHDYLEVEKARFEDGLEISMDVSPEVSTALVPPLILQPLLENAIKHGHPVDGIRTVSANAMHRNGNVVLLVSSTGQLGTSSDGTGLRLTRERLEQAFPGRHTFQLEQHGQTVTAAITIPGPAT